MMYKTLMKIFFKENFGMRRILGTDPKKNKGKTILILIALIYGLGAFLFVFGMMFFNLAEVLNSLNALNVLLIYAFFYSTALSMLFVIFRANGYIFNYKDYQILEPLPIKTKTVLAAKMSVMLIFIYASTLVFLAPIVFSYFYHGGFDIVSLIYFLIAFITIPLIPTIILSFLSLLISRISASFRRSNIVNLILLFAVFLGIMYLQMNLATLGDANPLLNQQEFMDNLSNIYPPIKWFVEAVGNHNILSLLLLLAVNGILFTGFVILIQGLVKKTNQSVMTIKTRKNHKKAVSKERPLMLSIATNESRRFFGMTLYAFNAGFGAVFMIILSVASLFVKDSIQTYLETFISAGLDAEILIIIVFSFCLSMTFTTAYSLSLEGKNFWIMKSLPIEPKKIMQGKILFNVILGLPIAVISLVILSYTIGFTLTKLLVMILFVTSISFLISTFGSIINLFVPKFDWRNPTEVIKQSAASMLGIFGSWFLLVIDGLIYYLAFKTLSFEMVFIIISVVNLILATVFLFFVNKKSESLFIKFEV